jgi:hypothetical protein
MHWLRPSEKVTVTNITTTAIFRIIHSIPEVQLFIRLTANIPRTLPWILLQELCNFSQVFRRQLHVSCTQIFQSALYISAGNEQCQRRGVEVGRILTKIQEAG